jgi:hypothetical protein
MDATGRIAGRATGHSTVSRARLLKDALPMASARYAPVVAAQAVCVK